MIYLILFLIPLLTMLWLGWLWWRLRRVGGRGARWMRWLCLGTTTVVLLDLSVGGRPADGRHRNRAPSLAAGAVAVMDPRFPAIDDLPEALDMIERLNPGRGLFNIEGNHDLFDGPEAFARGHADRGIPLLRDQLARLRVRGHPVEILGMRWSRREEMMRQQVAALAELSDPDAFPILLGHLPHAFDTALEHGIPLTLAGHTHGGQLMLTPEIGPGPVMFRYWSGIYRINTSSLVVSNGAGNWFPLRTSAPAEILHLTLHRA